MIVICMPLWQRPTLTRTILRQWHYQIHRLRGQVDLHLLVIGSEGKRSSALVSGYAGDTISYTEYPNDPLNRKWNHGVQVARSMAPEGIIIAGSDDLASDSIFLAWQEQLRAGIDFLGIRDLYFYSVASQQLGYWPGYGPTGGLPHRSGEPIGFMRGFSRRLLNATDWHLWPDPPARNSALDKANLSFLAKRGFQPHVISLDQIKGAKAVDVKADTSVTTWARIPYAQVLSATEAELYLSDLCDEEGLAELFHRGLNDD